MKLDDFFSRKRIKILACLALLQIACTIFIGIRKELLWDEIVVAVCAALFLYCIFAFGIEQNRIRAGALDEAANNFKRIGFFYGFSLLMTTGSMLSPFLLNFFLATTVLFTIVTDKQVGFYGETLWCILLFLTKGIDSLGLCMSLIFIITGSLLADELKQFRTHLFSTIILLSVGFCVPSFLQVMEHETITLVTLYEGLLCAVSNYLLILLFLPIAKKNLGVRKFKECKQIISEQYPLIQDLKTCSAMEYRIARLTSVIARGCAKEINCSPEICEAAGWYYRIGDLIGNPVVENGVKLAQQNLFPSEVIEILSQRNSMVSPLSTKEAAVVHISSEIAIKFQELKPEQLKTRFDLEFFVYQCMNTISVSGCLDYSGLGMNMFLKIREYLVKGEWWNDNYSF